jgi:hypothetical protein
MSDQRLFPIQADPGLGIWHRQWVPGPRSITWADAEVAYRCYRRLYGTYQSLARLAERGGFAWTEYLGLAAGGRLMEERGTIDVQALHAFVDAWQSRNYER